MARPDGAWLIVGADSTLGRALSLRLEADGVPYLGTTRNRGTSGPRRLHLDLENDISRWRIPESVSHAFLGAAVTSLDRCRRFPKKSSRVNVEQAVFLAERLRERGIFVLFPSTSLVFDGTKPFCPHDEPPSPKTEYGRQKSLAEAGLQARVDGLIAILRFTKVLAPRFPLFDEWRRNLKAGTPIHPFSDMVFSPVELHRAVEAIIRVTRARAPGIFQLSGDRDITYAEAALHIADIETRDRSLIIPVPADSSKLEWIPRHTTLDSERLLNELGVGPGNIHEALGGATHD